MCPRLSGARNSKQWSSQLDGTAFFAPAYVRCELLSPLAPGPLHESLEQTRASWRRAEGQRGVDLDALQLDDDVTQIHSL